MDTSNDKPKRIFDVDVNRAALKRGKDVLEFKKNNPDIFDHLGADEDRAYEELFAEVAPTASKPAAQGSAINADSGAKGTA